MNEARPYASLSSGLLARKGTAKPAMRPQGYSGGFEDLGWNDMGHGPDEEGPPAPEHVPSSIAALTPAPKHGRPAPSDVEDHDESEELEGAEEAEDVEAVQEYQGIQQADEGDELEAAAEAGEAPTFEDPAPFDARQAADPFDAAEQAAEEFGPSFDDPEPVEAHEAADEADSTEEAGQEFGPAFEDPAPFEAHRPAEQPQAGRFEAPSVVAQQRAILERFDGEEEAAPRTQAVPAPVVPLPQRHVDAEGRKAAFTLRLDSDRHLRLRLACAVSGRSAQQIVARALDQALASIPEIEALASQVPAKPGRANAKRN